MDLFEATNGLDQPLDLRIFVFERGKWWLLDGDELELLREEDVPVNVRIAAMSFPFLLLRPRGMLFGIASDQPNWRIQ